MGPKERGGIRSNLCAEPGKGIGMTLLLFPIIVLVLVMEYPCYYNIPSSLGALLNFECIIYSIIKSHHKTDNINISNIHPSFRSPRFHIYFFTSNK